MRRIMPGLFIILAVLVFPIVAPAQSNDKSLTVKLNYTGTGTVDEKHKIYVLVFDANPFTAEILAEVSSKPAKSDPASASKTAYILARQGASAKNQTLSFKGVPASPVYVLAFFDQAGIYDGRVDPAHGSPMGMYGSKPGNPDPVALAAGKPIDITVTFDDSNKTP